jgi:anti-sigma regulatory factor (Ser/Thr protein kinase)
MTGVDERRAIVLERATVEDLGSIRAFVRDAAREMDVPPDVEPDLLIAVDEMVTNVVVHGYGRSGGWIEVFVSRTADQLTIRIRDRGPIFDPTRRAAPDLTLDLDHRAPGGLGIHLARSSMDEMIHRAMDDGNELTLVKALGGDGRIER